MKRTILFFAVLLLISYHSEAVRKLVPQQYATIQAAISAAATGDTILVSPGIYFENINFRAKGIMVASTYILTNDTSAISSTVINGSQPVNPDSASCVIIASKVPGTAMDSTASLIGFTITGGKGTKWDDEHAPGSIYREGGGILIQYLSPRILHNRITNNEATDMSGGMQSAGGGAIRCGDSNPLIRNNVIDNNRGRYGAGIVFNYCGGMISNNLIIHNSGGQDFGGSGLWILGANAQASPRTVVNNTIVYNYSVGPGGGIRAWNTTITIKNNILWGNTAGLGKQIFAAPPTITVTYNDIQDGYTGAGNINEEPAFGNENYYLSTGSPCIDKGDSTQTYNDLPDPSNPPNAKFPSRGLLRNDQGAYGGPYSSLLSPFSVIYTGTGKEINLGPIPEMLIMPNPVIDVADIVFRTECMNDISTDIIDMNGKQVRHYVLSPSGAGTFRVRFSREDLGPGIYRVLLLCDNSVLASKPMVIN